MTQIASILAVSSNIAKNGIDPLWYEEKKKIKKKMINNSNESILHYWLPSTFYIWLHTFNRDTDLQIK